MRVLVTGAHGFLGSHITDDLLRSGHTVRVLVSPWGGTENLRTQLQHPRLELVRADLCVEDSLHGVCEGMDAVVHAAARVADWGRWDDFYKTNVLGTRFLLSEAAAAGARRFVLVSSVAVHRYTGFRDADPRKVPRDNLSNPYAHSKILAEDLVTAADGLEPVILRPGLWPFGPRDAQFRRVARATQQGMLPLVSGGSSIINTCFAENFALGVRLSLESDVAPHRVYVIADEGAPSWREL